MGGGKNPVVVMGRGRGRVGVGTDSLKVNFKNPVHPDEKQKAENVVHKAAVLELLRPQPIASCCGDGRSAALSGFPARVLDY